MNEKWIRRLILVLVVIITLGGIEVSARMVRGPWHPPQIPYRLDEDVGLWVESGPRTIINYENLETGEPEPWFINRYGMQDTSYALEKPDGVCRAAVLGDSFMQGPQVGRRNRLSSALDDSLGVGWQVLNFALSSVGTVHEMLIYEEKVRPFSPDLVVLGAYPANDVRNNSRVIERATDYGFLDGAPYFTVESDSVIFHRGRARETNWKTYLHDLAGYSYAMRAGKYMASVLQRAADLNGDGPELSEDAESGRLFGEPWPRSHLTYGIYSPPEHPAWKEAWQITRHALLRLRDSVRVDGAELVVLLMTSPPQLVRNPEVFLERRAGVKAPSDLNVDYPNERFCAMADSLDVRCVDMLPILRSYRDAHDLEFPYFWFETDGHWNALAHAIAADTLAAQVRSIGLTCQNADEPS